MFKTFKYLFVPALALIVTFMLFSVFSHNFLSVQKNNVKTESFGEVLIGGPFDLTNQNGEQVSNKDFIGKLMLVYFGFSNCPMVCPTDMANITAAMQQLSEDEVAQVQPIFITIDPARDTVEQLKSFSENFYPTFQMLTGTDEQIASAANAYRVYYKQVKAEDLQDYLMEHSAYIYLMGRDGKYVSHFRHDQPADEIAAGVRKHLM